MPPPLRKFLPLLAALALILGAWLLWWPMGPKPTAFETASNLADLGAPPKWEELAKYDGVLTREEFEQALREVYAWKPTWGQHFELRDDAVHLNAPELTIRFAPEGAAKSPPRFWRSAAELPPAPAGQPLWGLKIAIDPGHLGGKYAKEEERWYQLDGSIAVQEGDMTLLTAQLLKPRLEALGADVSLVRTTTEPVSDKLPADFRSYAKARRPGANEAEIEAYTKRLAYRTAEIRARAELVNETIKPDLVLCLHYNAEAWGDPAKPTLTRTNHFHLILHGAYMPEELDHEDERFEMMQKIFQRTHQEELAISREVAASFARETKLLPYSYRLDSPAKSMGSALYARNLLANRLYVCPVIFLEPYVMNNKLVYERVQAGDYEGEREIAGALRKSLYREYADTVTAGLRDYYQSSRNP